MKFTPAKPSLHGETLDSLGTRLAEAGEPAYRARQILDWLYKKRATRWDQMTNLSRPLRAWLADAFELEPHRPRARPPVGGRDGTSCCLNCATIR